MERNLKIVASRRGQNLLCGLSKSGNKLVVICNYLWLNKYNKQTVKKREKTNYPVRKLGNTTMIKLTTNDIPSLFRSFGRMELSGGLAVLQLCSVA
jgi:hypothetical protein